MTEHGGDLTTATRGARTAARLRQAAREAFSELGWQGTRVEDIVQRAGVSHGTFYTYYDNKAAVLADLVRGSQTRFAELASAPWKSDDVRGALERIIGGFLDHYAQDRIVMRTWLQAAREERSFSELYVQARALFVRRVADNVAATVAASGRTAGPPALTVASSLVAMVEHFAYCWTVLGEEHERADAVASLVLIWGSTLNELAGFEVVGEGRASARPAGGDQGEGRAPARPAGGDQGEGRASARPAGGDQGEGRAGGEDG